MTWLLSFLPLWVWAVAGIVAVVAAWNFLGRPGAIIAAFAASVIAAYATGASVERERSNAVALTAEIARLKDEKAEAERQQQVSISIQAGMAEKAAATRAEATKLQERADALEDELRREASKAPPACRCGFTDDQRRRLQSDIPIGARADPTAR
ncbi:hypothetical protein [Chelatococcus asaccharovorans]|uniref:Uncharacterized protein n=1 Tax=Chelatococcus asaccharovorans TaxID=28210 RepID=A0A2V3UB52_9HYPH|nr:hypothetical protein [Chelatococcus asaccharovorans]MBS7703341.1 hypothetical protein [Chelatococcus asaccharovorans]PXW61677.1 hypothetical protein C7450_103194 [Chelatococcus asaccharovorans]